MPKLNIRLMVGMAVNYADNFFYEKKSKWRLIRDAYAMGFQECNKIRNEEEAENKTI